MFDLSLHPFNFFFFITVGLVSFPAQWSLSHIPFLFALGRESGLWGASLTHLMAVPGSTFDKVKLNLKGFFCLFLN